MLTLTVIGLPAPQGSKRGFYNANLGRVQMVESSKKVKPWRQDVKAAALNAIAESGGSLVDPVDTFPMLGPVHVSIVFYLPRPGYHYRTGKHVGELKPDAPVYVDKKPDLDKIIRSTCDALGEAGAYRDDAQVAEFVVTKKYAAGPWAELDVPGAVITVAPMTPTAAVSEECPPVASDTAHDPQGVLL